MTSFQVRKAVVVPDDVDALPARKALPEVDEDLERRRPQPPHINHPGSVQPGMRAVDMTKLTAHLRGGKLDAFGARLMLEQRAEEAFSVLSAGSVLFSPVESAYSRDSKIAGKVYEIKNSTAMPDATRGEIRDSGTFLVKPLNVKRVLRVDGYFRDVDMIVEQYTLQERDLAIPVTTAMEAGVHNGDTLVLLHNPLLLPTPTMQI